MGYATIAGSSTIYSLKINPQKDEFPELDYVGHTAVHAQEMGIEEFSLDTSHADLDRETNENVDTLNERSGGLHYNALPKIHQTLTNTCFKQVQSNNRIHHYNNDVSHNNDVSRHPAYGMHVIASWAGYKLRLRSGKAVTGRHYKQLQKHLVKYSQS